MRRARVAALAEEHAKRVAGFATLARHVTASTGMNQAMNVPGGVS